MSRLGQAMIGLALLAAGAPAAAQARSLHWKSLAVTARLDADGVLHVRERHHVVMTGDWNGGSRDFRLEPNQQIQLERMARIDPVTGAARPMVAGDLARLDGYAWTGPATLRWRSRLPADPPFSGTELVHELEYRLRGAVETDGSGYVLEHDFAFGEREGDILSHVVDLDLDPAWKVATGAPHVHVERVRLRPGEGNVVRVALQYAGAGAPAHVVSRVRVRRLLLALLLVPAALFAHLLLGERRRGRFAPVSADVAAGAGFLDQHLLTVRAEVAGAAWDRDVGPPEVAALVARLAAEGALSTRSQDDVLHLELAVPRESLDDYERALVDGFFFDGRTATSTSEVRAHYGTAGSGFYPDAVIRPGVAARVAALVGSRPLQWPHWILPGAALLAGAVVILAASPDGFTLLSVGALFGLPALVLGLAGLAFAALWRNRVDHGLRDTLWFVVPAGLLLVLGWAAVGDPVWPLDAINRAVAGSGAPALELGAVLVAIGWVGAICANARSRESAAGLALRKRLAAARAYFERELEREEPALRDQWFPYVLAFGLDDSSRRWFERYGGQTASRSPSVTVPSWSGSSPSGPGTAPTGPTPWTGGGGAFGGAGASASWAQAAHTLSAGIAPPAPVASGGSSGDSGGSSGWRSGGGSSSGSSGSGGSRSGGGGGGGW